MRAFNARFLPATCPARSALAREVEGNLLERGLEVERAENGERLSLAVWANEGGDALEVEVRCRCGGGAEAPPRGPEESMGSGDGSAGPPGVEVDCRGRSAGELAKEVVGAFAELGLFRETPAPGYSDDEERRIAERLEDLGYL